MRKNGKILIIGTQGRSVTSGPGTFMRYLCEAIQSEDLDAEVLYPHGPRDTPFSEYGFVNFCPRAERFHNSFFGSWIISSFLLWRWLKHDHRADAYTCFWFADRFSALFCVMDPALRGRCFAMVNDDTRIKRKQPLKGHRGGFLKRFIRNLSGQFFFVCERYIVRRAGRVVSNSDYLSRSLSVSYNLGPDRLIRLYKAVDIKAFTRRESVPFSTQPFSFLFIKNEWYRGGLDTLIKALAEIDCFEAALSIAGISGQKPVEEIRAIAHSSEFRHTLNFLGVVERSKIPGLIRDADCLCVPSREEALGVVFLEGIASGTPVIGSCEGGIPEVLANGSAGLMVPADDVSALRDAIIGVATDPVGRTERRMFGLTHAEMFSKESMIQSIQRYSNEIGVSRG